MPYGNSPTPGDAQDSNEASGFVKKRQKRLITVYDAVAGRVNSHGFIPRTPYTSKYRDTGSSSNIPVPPEEVLFRRKNAPTRYEENDFYFTHESLPPDCPLPSSDLLEAIHTFCADFYGQATYDHGEDDHRSMDETALIAMGILLEEMAQESLGETGDLALVEGEEVPTDEDDEPVSRIARRIRRRRPNTARVGIQASSGDDLDRVVRRRKRSKKRKPTFGASATDPDTEIEERERETQ